MNIYYTFKKKPKTQTQKEQAEIYNLIYQMSMEDILNTTIEDDIAEKYAHTQTIFIPKDKIERNKYVEQAENYIASFAELGKETFPNGTSQEDYDSFKIPKASGGFRQIDAPKEALMKYLSDLKNTFEQKMNLKWHDNAYAYTKQRTAYDALKVHQQNNSKWFLKLDVQDFFPSCSVDVLMHQLSKIYPFALFTEEGMTNLKQVLEYCVLDGKLPQGTPMSPILTNLIMIPFDYEVVYNIRNKVHSEFIYTRYADDLLISNKYNFTWSEICKSINETFEKLGYPFKLKDKKTRYGSSAGSNWNLGLMLNKDNNITIGHKNKKRLKAAICNFFLDLTKGNPWSIIDTQTLMGKISYYRAIEPGYINYVIQQYNKKFNKDLDKEAKKIIHPNYN